ncbi:MAG TPA: LysR family transcriptional regulator [Steroidobacteraceae bacterium]
MAVFVRVVSLRGFAAAARETGISATMAAKHVQALEKHLGLRLLNRTTRRQSLTEAGELYYERCKKLLADADEVDSSIRLMRATPRGTLRVTAPVSFGTRRLAPALAGFLKAYPDINVDLTLSDRMVDLVQEGFEAAIRVGRPVDSQLIACPLHPYRSMLCASPDYIRRHGQPKVPQDLLKHDCLGFTLAGVRGRWRLRRHGEEQIVTFTPRLRVDNGEGLRQAALAGAGIILQPEVLLADDVSTRQLIRILPGWELPSKPMHLVYIRDHHRMTPKLRCFIDFAVEQFKR